jgi:hypothetical protein
MSYQGGAETRARIKRHRTLCGVAVETENGGVRKRQGLGEATVEEAVRTRQPVGTKTSNRQDL